MLQCICSLQCTQFLEAAAFLSHNNLNKVLLRLSSFGQSRQFSHISHHIDYNVTPLTGRFWGWVTQQTPTAVIDSLIVVKCILKDTIEVICVSTLELFKFFNLMFLELNEFERVNVCCKASSIMVPLTWKTLLHTRQVKLYDPASCLPTLEWNIY